MRLWRALQVSTCEKKGKYRNPCAAASFLTTSQHIGARSSQHGGTTHLKQNDLYPRNEIMATFFARYPSFGHQPLQSSSTEFYRMCDFFGWERAADERRYAHDGFKTALVQQFNAIYGTDASDIKSWVGLCTVLGVKPLPGTLEEATKVSNSYSTARIGMHTTTDIVSSTDLERQIRQPGRFD